MEEHLTALRLSAGSTVALVGISFGAFVLLDTFLLMELLSSKSAKQGSLNVLTKSVGLRTSRLEPLLLSKAAALSMGK